MRNSWSYNVLPIAIISIALEKYKKECNIVLIILVQGFCPLKIEFTVEPHQYGHQWVKKIWLY